jgi:hypothetical protein
MTQHESRGGARAMKTSRVLLLLIVIAPLQSLQHSFTGLFGCSRDRSQDVSCRTHARPRQVARSTHQLDRHTRPYRLRIWVCSPAGIESQWLHMPSTNERTDGVRCYRRPTYRSLSRTRRCHHLDPGNGDAITGHVGNHIFETLGLPCITGSVAPYNW